MAWHTKAESLAKAGTVDGRLPGYRERVPTNEQGDARIDVLLSTTR